MGDMDSMVNLGDNLCMTTTQTHATSANADVVDPPQDLAAMMDLSKFLDAHEAPAALLGPDGEQIPLPMEAYEVLRRVVRAMGRGSSVTVDPVDRQLTTQQAAQFLGISRNTLVRLLDEHELPYERLGESRHRRLRLQDVLAYRARKRAERRERLDEMTRQASEDGLYDVGSSAYTEALAAARKS